MSDTREITEALNWWTAERFKTLQRKLTTAKNTIQSEALSPSFAPFLSVEEIHTLREAARILGSAKSKVEHAKEIRAREEREKELHYKKCASQRKKLIDSAFPPVDTADDVRAMLLAVLALQLHHHYIARNSYFTELQYIEREVNRAFDSKYPHLSPRGVAEGWRLDIMKFLEEELWFLREEPDPKKLDVVLLHMRSDWLDSVMNNPACLAIVERFDTEMSIDSSSSVTRLDG